MALIGVAMMIAVSANVRERFNTAVTYVSVNT